MRESLCSAVAGSSGACLHITSHLLHPRSPGRREGGAHEAAADRRLVAARGDGAAVARVPGALLAAAAARARPARPLPPPFPHGHRTRLEDSRRTGVRLSVPLSAHTSLLSQPSSSSASVPESNAYVKWFIDD